jgi:RNA polymerase sigma factor (sigma-70 family)
MEDNESHLIESWAQGNRVSAEVLIRQYYPYAYALCLGYCKGNQELTNNAIQLFFIRFTQYLPRIYQEDKRKFESIKDNFQAYLIAGVKNNAREQIRLSVRQNLKIAPISSLSTQKIEPNTATNSFERKNVLVYILSFLPNSQQQVYQLYLEGYSYEEIAKQMDLNKSQVRGRIERSNKALKKHRVLIKHLLMQ